MNKTEKRKCEVCGARVRNWNNSVTTCDPTCNKAKHSGRTRAQQFAFEMDKEIAAEEAQAAWETNLSPGAGGNLELSNRPYLSLAFA